MSENLGKFLIFDGSPRKNGNTAILSQEIGKGITENKKEFEIIKLQELDINPCLGCNACQKNKNHQCVQKDDMNNLYPRLIEAEAIILASPIYWFTITAQMKMFIDRIYALNVGYKNALRGKKMAAVLVYGDVDPYLSGAVNAISTLKNIFDWNKPKFSKIIYGSALQLGAVKKNARFMKSAYELGKSISSN